MADEKRLLDVVTNVVLDCQELPGDDQLFVLQLAWWATSVEYSQRAGRDIGRVAGSATGRDVGSDGGMGARRHV